MEKLKEILSEWYKELKIEERRENIISAFRNFFGFEPERVYVSEGIFYARRDIPNKLINDELYDLVKMISGMYYDVEFHGVARIRLITKESQDEESGTYKYTGEDYEPVIVREIVDDRYVHRIEIVGLPY